MSTPNYNPCCGFTSAKTGTKIIAIFQVVLFLTILVFSSTVTILRFFFWPVPHLAGSYDANNDMRLINKALGDERQQFGFFILQLPIIFWSLVAFIAAITLFKGARDEILSKCKIWMVINVTITFLTTIGLFVLLIFFTTPIYIPLLMFCSVGIHLYFVLVVYSFMQQVYT